MSYGTKIRQDGKPYYYKDNPEAVAKRDARRMFVGKYISKKHPLHKHKRYKTLDDAWSHERQPYKEIYYILSIIAAKPSMGGTR